MPAYSSTDGRAYRRRADDRGEKDYVEVRNLDGTTGYMYKTRGGEPYGKVYAWPTHAAVPNRSHSRPREEKRHRSRSRSRSNKKESRLESRGSRISTPLWVAGLFILLSVFCASHARFYALPVPALAAYRQDCFPWHLHQDHPDLSIGLAPRLFPSFAAPKPVVEARLKELAECFHPDNAGSHPNITTEEMQEIWDLYEKRSEHYIENTTVTAALLAFKHTSQPSSVIIDPKMPHFAPDCTCSLTSGLGNFLAIGMGLSPPLPETAAELAHYCPCGLSKALFFAKNKYWSLLFVENKYWALLPSRYHPLWLDPTLKASRNPFFKDLRHRMRGTEDICKLPHSTFVEWGRAGWAIAEDGRRCTHWSQVQTHLNRKIQDPGSSEVQTHPDKKIQDQGNSDWYNKCLSIAEDAGAIASKANEADWEEFIIRRKRLCDKGEQKDLVNDDDERRLSKVLSQHGAQTKEPAQAKTATQPETIIVTVKTPIYTPVLEEH